MHCHEHKPKGVVAKLLGLAALLAAFVPSADAQVPGQVVTIDSGRVSGIVTEQGRKFLGIPYAAPPTGPRRWQPPAAPQRWSHVRSTTQVGSNCPQPASPFGSESLNEDCLYLNVYTPPVRRGGGASRNDPVLVWLHPGAFQYGTGSDFEPRQLVARNLVVVTLNYRLGSLGFLAHPALSAERAGSSGNYGLLDQQAALRWVKRNIARFGGDASKITIGGESAGGLSAHAHMVAPGSAELFQNAIVQSGAYALELPTVAQSELQGVAFSDAVGCTSAAAECLRSTPVATLLANQGAGVSAYLPIVDGSTLPLSIKSAFATGRFHRVHVLEGSTHDEFTLFIAALFTLPGIPLSAENYEALIATILQIPGEQAAKVVPLIVAQYPLANYANLELALAAIGTDAVFACNASTSAQLLSEHVPVWSYEFDDPDAPQIIFPPVSYPYGAYHGAELQYLFDVRQPIPGTLEAAQQQLSEAMVLHWSNFVRFGNPNTLQTSVWPRYRPPQSDRVQLLTTPSPQAYTQTAFNHDHKCELWAQLQIGS